MSRPGLLIAGRYRLVERVGAGGMGSVWEAWDERLHRRVALKQLHPQPGLSAAEAHLASKRAMREARITARLHHANAVPVYDAVDHDGMPCLIMQYLPSTSLQDALTERGTLSIAEVARIGSEVAAALAAAHEVGIVHRDVKPGNVLIDSEGSAKLTDFGISHALGDVTLTSTGMVTGTPAFLAPEVARGIESGFASDVFSLGATLYAASEGTPPFGRGENPMAVLHRVASGQVNPPQRSGQLTPVLTAMLAADPASRPSMAQAADALAAVHVAATDPASMAPTQRMVPPPSVARPPSTRTLPPVRLSSDAAPAPPSRAGRNTTIALLVLLLVTGAILLATQLGGGPSSQGRANNSPSSNPAPPLSTYAERSSQAASSPPQTSASPADTTTNGSGLSTSNGGTPDTSTSQIQAVAAYYGLLPDNTATAWNLLTPAYQGQAGGRSSYDSFWSSFRSVEVSNERMQGDQVLADLRYTSTNGTVSTETRSFQLVREGGILKIARSSVVSG
ncbi:MAG: eukaryotic-like serine/threonine-protein kinase [Pseudonocardiales bacterium]|nr:eukaryotic-like serine/threonine-protein kinase [Pseudonocardiales bacterium]